MRRLFLIFVVVLCLIVPSIGMVMAKDLLPNCLDPPWDYDNNLISALSLGVSNTPFLCNDKDVVILLHRNISLGPMRVFGPPTVHMGATIGTEVFPGGSSAILAFMIVDSALVNPNKNMGAKGLAFMDAFAYMRAHPDNAGIADTWEVPTPLKLPVVSPPIFFGDSSHQHSADVLHKSMIVCDSEFTVFPTHLITVIVSPKRWGSEGTTGAYILHFTSPLSTDLVPIGFMDVEVPYAVFADRTVNVIFEDQTRRSDGNTITIG